MYVIHDSIEIGHHFLVVLTDRARKNAYILYLSKALFNLMDK